METLKELALDLGGSTSFTADQVVELSKELAKLGFTTNEIVNSAGGILDLAAAMKIELAEAAIVTGTTLNAFGLDAAETGRVVDVMTKAFNSSALDVQKFRVGMRSVAPIAAEVGLELEEVTATLGILADKGIRAETAGTGLRNILLTTAKTGQSVAEAFLQINTATDSVAEATRIFGKENANVAVILAKNEEAVKSLSGTLVDSFGTASAAAEIQLDTLAGKTTILASAWDGFIKSLESGEGPLSNFLKSVVDLTTEAIKGIELLTLSEEQLGEKADKEIKGKVLKHFEALGAELIRLNRVASDREGTDSLLNIMGLITEEVEISEDAVADLVIAWEVAKDEFGAASVEANDAAQALANNRLAIDKFILIQKESTENNLTALEVRQRLRGVTLDAILTKREETEAFEEGLETAKKEKKSITDLIKLKQEELKIINKMPGATRAEVAARNERIKAIQDEIKELKSLTTEQLKFEKLRRESTPELIENKNKEIKKTKEQEEAKKQADKDRNA